VRLVVQRVREAAVRVDGAEIARIGSGLLILIGIAPTDGDADSVRLAAKTLALRIFADADRPMNRSVVDVGGEVMVVSQFTLIADTSRGNRPGFSTAASPQHAERLYDRFVAEVRARLGRVATGRFGADMQVVLVNDGPVTFVLD
jgi:D-tyrosyl-tRNA(Tyr) deacylase